MSYLFEFGKPQSINCTFSICTGQAGKEVSQVLFSLLSFPFVDPLHCSVCSGILCLSIIVKKVHSLRSKLKTITGSRMFLGKNPLACGASVSASGLENNSFSQEGKRSIFFSNKWSFPLLNTENLRVLGANPKPLQEICHISPFTCNDSATL